MKTVPARVTTVPDTIQLADSGLNTESVNLTPSRYTSWTRNTPFAGSFTCAPSER